ncbi:MAG: hypothetical protein AABX07_05765 [Nanoarchaeota archaeon]
MKQQKDLMDKHLMQSSDLSYGCRDDVFYEKIILYEIKINTQRAERG